MADYFQMGLNDSLSGRRMRTSGPKAGREEYSKGYAEGQRRRADDIIGLKDNDIAAIVNELTAIAVQYGQTQQCRERISHVVLRVLKPSPGVLAHSRDCGLFVGNGADRPRACTCGATDGMELRTV